MLDVSENQIEDLRNIGCFRNLLRLNLARNCIASVEILGESDLSGCNCLVSLDCSYNPVVQVQGKPIDPRSVVGLILSAMPKLRTLSLEGIPGLEQLRISSQPSDSSLVYFNGKRIVNPNEFERASPDDRCRVGERIKSVVRRLEIAQRLD